MTSLPALSYYPSAVSSFGSFSSPDDSNDISERITAASVHSYSETESDNDSLASGTRSMNRVQSFDSPRSIFDSYWSSHTYTNTLLEEIHNDNEAMVTRLQTLQLPFAIDDVKDYKRSSSRGSAATNKISHAPIEPKKKYNRHDVDCHTVLATSSQTRSPRRQILPTPPPSMAISSSLIEPRRKMEFLLAPRTPLGKVRSLSTSALLKSPYQSCLRKSSYSCSAIATHRDATSTGRLNLKLCKNSFHDLQQLATSTSSILRDELKKSVSFYSQVSVFIFADPQDQQRSQQGWSKQFA